MRVVTLLDETLRFVSLSTIQTHKCHVQHTARMDPYCTLTLCGMDIPDDAAVRPKRTIAANAICGRCTRVLNAYYTELPGMPGHGRRALIGEHAPTNVAEERMGYPDAICEQCVRGTSLKCPKCGAFTCTHYSLWANNDPLGPNGEQLVHRCNWCQCELEYA